MVQKVPQAFSTGLSSQFRNIEEKCSCTKCDSLFCFSKRHAVDSCSCSCKNCKESKTCLFFTNRLVRVNESHSDATNAAPISAITSATGNNVHSNSKYPSSYNVISTKSNEATIPSKQTSNTLAITSKQPSYTLAITDKQTSKTLAITHKQPSAITPKPSAYGSEFGTKVLGASETRVQAIHGTQTKPIESSLNALKSCCADPIQSTIPTPETPSCGHHRSAEIYRVPEQISCVSKEGKPPSSPGYVLELNTNKSTKDGTNTCEVKCVDNYKSTGQKTLSAKYTGDNICDENASECKSAKLAPNSPGYIIDLKNRTICGCKAYPKDVAETPPFPLDSSGYVLDLTKGSYKQTKNPLETCKNIFTNQLNAIKALCNTCITQSNPIRCGQGASACKSAKPALDTRDLINDLKKEIICDCNECQRTPCGNKDNSKKEKTGSERMSRGYVVDIPKPYRAGAKPKENVCDCNEPKLVSDPPGYIYDLKNITSCDCDQHKIVSDPPGYVYDFKRRLKLQRKTTCDCKLLPENGTYPSGYVYIIPGQKSKDKSKTLPGKQSNIETQNNKYLPDPGFCSNCSEPNNAHENKYIVNLCVNQSGKTKKEMSEAQKSDCSSIDSDKAAPNLSKSISGSQGPSSYKLELCRNILEIQKSAIETLDNLCLLQKDSCDFPPYQTEPRRYLQGTPSVKQQLCANILETELNAVSMLTCTTQENTCSYSCSLQDDSKSLSCKEILTMKSQSESSRSKTNNCLCEPSQNSCGPNVSNTDIQTHKSGFNNNRQKFLINFVETKRNGFESLRSSYKMTSCECNNKESPGYSIELQKSKEDPTNKTNENTNNTGQKKKCDCEESRKRLSSSAGYILELDQYKHEAVNRTRKSNKNSFEMPKTTADSLTYECQKNCDSRKRLSSSAGYILDLDQYKHEPLNKTRKLSKNLLDVQRNTIESVNNTSLKKGCECSEPQKRLSESAGYILELTQYTNLPTSASQRLTNIQEFKGDNIQSFNNSCQNSCACKKPSKNISEASGYILELDQYKLSKNISETQKNTIKRNSCACSEGHNRLSESDGYVVDMGKYKQELATKTHKLSKNIFGIQKDNIESLSNPNQKKSCACSDARKRSSAGYVLELEQYKNKLSNAVRELSKTSEEVKERERQDNNKCKCSQGKEKPFGSAFELQANARQVSNIPKSISNDVSELTTNTTCQKSCVCRKPSQIISDPPGYVYELDQYKQERVTHDKQDSNKCKCSQGKEKPFGSAFELQANARQVSNIPKSISNDIPELTTNTICQKSCVCRKPSQIISDPPGYVYELDQYKQERLTHDKQDNTKCKCSQGKEKPFGSAFELQANARQVSNIPKSISNDISELTTNTTCQKSCVCRKPSQIISDPPGYVYELDQYKQERVTHDKQDNIKCKCSQGKEKPFGSAFELQANARQVSNIPKSISNDVSELTTNTTCQKSCVCRKPSQIISDPPGYVYELDQYKQERVTHDKQDNTKCKCSQGKEKPFGSAFELQANARQVSNIPKSISNDVSELTTNTTCQKSCVCRKPSQIISDPPGYVYALDQYKQERATHDRQDNNKCKCSQGKEKPFGSAFELQANARQVSNIPKSISNDVSELTTNTTCQKSCVCRKPSQIISDPPGYVYALDQYKQERATHDRQDNNKCKCSQGKEKPFGSTFEIHEIARQLSNIPKKVNKDISELMTNTTCYKSCVCRKPSQIISDPPGYVYELDQYKQERVKHGTNKCKCSQGKENLETFSTSTSGYILDLEKYKRESANKTHIVGKNIFEVQRNTIEPLNYSNQNKKCGCSDSRKRSSAGYILDLHQYAQAPLNAPHPLTKNDCAYRESQKKFPSSAGYVLELEQYKKGSRANVDDSQSEACQCKDSSKNTFDPCHVSDMKPNENRFKRNMYQAPINTTDVSDSCNCSGPSGNPFESPDKFYNDHRKIQGPTKNALEVCKNIFGTHMNPFDELDNTQKPCCDYVETTSNCNQTEKYVLEIPKSSKGTIVDAKKSKSNFDLPEFLISLHKHVPTKNILEMCKSILDKQDNLNEKLQASKKEEDGECSCEGKKNNESTLSAQESKLKSQKTSFDLCNHLGTPSAIQKIKNIYLPPRYTLEYTKNYEYPANNTTNDQPVKEVHSVKVSYSRAEVTGTAMLSAEVMNLPYTDFHDSLARKQEDSPEKANKLSKYDIFKRIKEAYKACSCKVCECIIGKSSTKNELCECKPCECKDCTSYLDKFNYKSPATPISHGSNSLYTRSNKGHSQRSIEQREPCDCKPCDCLKCTHLTPPCDCEPCQCVVCQRQKKVHKTRTLVVAPVGETVQRVTCTCSPCDCIECGQGFPATSRTTNEMSTATNRHALCRCELCLNERCEHGGVDSCRCERQKGVINKPVEKDSHDFDIRTASVVHQKQTKSKLCSRHDTIAMFAALPYTFPTFAAQNKPSTTKTCSCEECECVSCVCKENAINAIKSSQLFPSSKSPMLSNYNVLEKSKLNSMQHCNCTNCECEICDKYFDAQLCDSNVSIEQNKNCVCNVCDCINCAGESKVIKYSFNGLSECSICQCTDCEIKIKTRMGRKYQCSECSYKECFEDKCLSNQIVHPIKRGELLTPSTHRSKVQSLMLEKQRLSLPIASNNCETLKCDAYMQCQERNRGKSLPKNNSIDNKISGSAFSAYSSFETSPKTSCHKDYGGLTPVSQNKIMSMESSCNSSGHDYPEYLIQFPKSTVETCLKDVMELNMDKTIALDKFNIVPKKSQVGSMTNELMSERDNLSQSNGCNVISLCDCKTVTAKCTESINQYHNISNSCMDCNYYAYAPWEPDFIDSTCCRNCKFEMENDSRPGAFESLQTEELSHHNFSGRIEESASSITVTGCETKTESRKCFHILQKVNDVHVACETLQCNASEQKPANTLFQIKNEEILAWKYSKSISQGNFGGDVDRLNSDEDYTRVQKTLKEAKKYSAELMQMLEMFEKANKEFKSIADKLKIPQVSVSRDVFVEDDGMQKCFVKEEGFNEIEHELQEIPLEALSVREVLTSTSILQESVKPARTFAECENDFNTISKKMGRTELKTISDHETCNLLKGECDLTNKLSTANQCFPMQQHEMCPDKATTEETGNNSKDSVLTNKAIDTYLKDKGSIYYDTRGSTLDCQHIRKKDRINCKNFKKYSKFLKRTIIISKRVSLKNSNLNTPCPIVKYCITEGTSAANIKTDSNDERNYSITVNNSKKESIDSYGYNSQSKCRQNMILRKLDSVFEVLVSTSTDTYGLERDSMSLNESDSSSVAQGFEETRPSPILKKNYFNSKPNTKNKGVCIFPSLELQIKQAVQSISLQTSSSSTPKKKSIISHHENKALAKLQDEVKKLLDMPILQVQTPSTCRRDNTKESLNLQAKNKLELELKERPEASFHSSWKDVKNVDKEVWCSFKREAVESLIRDLLHLSVMPPLETEADVVIRATDNIENNKKTPRIITPKCSCDSLKVGFLGVRRVSDHTVLVKWNVPRKLDKVHGYELLVDGRAVQKIFSPTKSMAVVTCLPHTDKVLLTIRTITSSVFVTGHYPATTTIYRPRAKY